VLITCPRQKENTRNVHNFQEVTIVQYVARTVPRIYVALEDCQVYQ
jgi:hypothetical protein